MTNERWLLPEGIEEILPRQAARLEAMRRRLLDLFSTWGYELVIPPLIEYLESLLTGVGNDLDLKTFKLTDQLNGRLMGVRADMTPQVARIDSHLLRREEPTRLCYLGTVLHTRPESHGASRSPLQVGAELYGHSGIESDVEIIALMLATLAEVGIEPPCLDLGHVGVFRGLLGQAGLEPAQEAVLFDALQRKSKPEIAGLLENFVLSASMRRMLLGLVDLNGSEEVLDEAETVLADAGDAVRAALANLRAIAAALRSRLGEALALHFDLAELRGYRYHTGMVFAAYTPGRGQAVAQGGRYDDIGQVFGRARPATGFSADLKELLALGSDNGPQNRGIFAPCADEPGVAEQVQQLRSRGERVVCALPGQSGGAREMGCDRRLLQVGKQWQIEPLDSD